MPTPETAGHCMLTLTPVCPARARCSIMPSRNALGAPYVAWPTLPMLDVVNEKLTKARVRVLVRQPLAVRLGRPHVCDPRRRPASTRRAARPPMHHARHSTSDRTRISQHHHHKRRLVRHVRTAPRVRPRFNCSCSHDNCSSRPCPSYATRPDRNTSTHARTLASSKRTLPVYCVTITIHVFCVCKKAHSSLTAFTPCLPQYSKLIGEGLLPVKVYFEFCPLSCFLLGFNKDFPSL